MYSPIHLTIFSTGIHGGCLSNCSVTNPKPDLEETKTYSIKTMVITFSRFSLKRFMTNVKCGSSSKAVSVNLNVRCEGSYIYGTLVLQTNKCKLSCL